MKTKTLTKSKMKDDHVVHIKLGYDEAVKSRKDVLSSEMNLLRIAQIMKEYQALRFQELEIKNELRKKMKSLIVHLKNLETILPTLKIPSILKKEEIDEEGKTVVRRTVKTTVKEHGHDIESQLQEIQDKLKRLAA
ncbi:MAG: hypothetical protein ABIB79_01760 [archaeon]